MGKHMTLLCPATVPSPACAFSSVRLLNSERNAEAGPPIPPFLVCPALSKPALQLAWERHHFPSLCSRITLSEARRACCGPALKPYWIHRLPMIRVTSPLVSAGLWLVPISFIEPWPYALGYQQEQGTKYYNLQGTVSIIIPAATTTGQGWGVSTSLVETLRSSLTWHFALCHAPPGLEIIFLSH